MLPKTKNTRCVDIHLYTKVYVILYIHQHANLWLAPSIKKPTKIGTPEKTMDFITVSMSSTCLSNKCITEKTLFN